MKKKILAFGVLGLTILFFGAGFSWAQNIKIGAVLPITGPMGLVGKTVQKVMTMAVEDINAQGGVKALGGAKLELVVGDNQTKPEIAISEVERLIEREGVVALTEAWGSFITLPASQTAERLTTVYLVPNSYADSITARGFEYTFQINPKASGVARDWVRFLDYANAKFGKKFSKIGVIYENTDMGQACALAAKKLAEEKGYKIVADLSYPARASDLTTTIAKLKAGAPDVILQASYVGDAILIAKTAGRLGLNAPVVDNGNINDPSYIKSLGAVAEGKFGIAAWNKDIPGGRKLHDHYKARWGEEINSIYAEGYQAILLIKEAIEKAKSADRKAIRSAMAAINIPGDKLILPFEKIQFDKTGYNIGGNWTITQVQKGEWVTVWPEKYASQPPLFK